MENVINFCILFSVIKSNHVQVSPGSDCIFAQDVMAINTAAKQCCAIGELGKRVVVTPNVDSLLNSVIDLG